MDRGIGSAYDQDIERVFKKHKVAGMVLVHHPGPVEKYEKLVVGNVTLDWEIGALEGFVNELEKMNNAGKILTNKPVFPSVDKEAVLNGYDKAVEQAKKEP